MQCFIKGSNCVFLIYQREVSAIGLNKDIIRIFVKDDIFLKLVFNEHADNYYYNLKNENYFPTLSIVIF